MKKIKPCMKDLSRTVSSCIYDLLVWSPAIAVTVVAKGVNVDLIQIEDHFVFVDFREYFDEED